MRSTMSSEEFQTLSSDSVVELPHQEQSKKAAKKEAAKEEKLCHRLHELHARIMQTLGA